MEKNQQAINIFLESPEGNPKTANAVPDLTATDLNTDQGMNFFEKLDKVFQSETTDESTQHLYLLKGHIGWTCLILF